MAGKTLYDKLWESHVVREESDGTCLLYIDRHLMHEVTSPQAFEGLRLAGRRAWRSSSIVANPDHNTPTDDWDKGIKDPISRLQVETLDANIKEFGALVYFPFKHANQGIIHVIGPENGTTLPGMTVVCGDSHTSTHGAFGALAHGIGTSEVEHVMATQTLLAKKAKNMLVRVEGSLPRGCAIFQALTPSPRHQPIPAAEWSATTVAKCQSMPRAMRSTLPKSNSTMARTYSCARRACSRSSETATPSAAICERSGR